MNNFSIPLAGEKQRIGLLGGSFDPPHQGHIELSRLALKKMQLDWVWWLISPQNVLKKHAPANIQARFVSCEKIIAKNNCKIKPTNFESNFASCHTIDSLQQLKLRCPKVSFVWLMGSDNLLNFHHWQQWQKIASLVPIAIFSRQNYPFTLAQKFTTRFLQARLDSSDGKNVPSAKPPAWIYFTDLQCDISSSQKRGLVNE